MRGIPVYIALSLLIAGPALAEEAAKQLSPSQIRSDRLDALFAKLHQDAGEAAIKKVERDIWALWGASDSPTAEVLLQQAARAMNDGAPEQSLSILNRLIGAHPDFAEAWNKRATLYFAMKRYDDSLKDIDKVLDLEPRHFGALAGKGMIHQRQKNYGAALDAFKDALAINPNMPSVQDAVTAIEKIEQAI